MRPARTVRTARTCAGLVGAVLLGTTACSGEATDPDEALRHACAETSGSGSPSRIETGPAFTTTRFVNGGTDEITPDDPASTEYPTVGVDDNRAWVGVLITADGVCAAVAYAVDLEGWRVRGGLIRVRHETGRPAAEPDDDRIDVEFSPERFPATLSADGPERDSPLASAAAPWSDCVQVSAALDLAGPGGSVATWYAQGRYGARCDA
ncbi:hypothetical protein [Nocardioides acrostichi]|uniref:Lipoprotein n=1 Tax=Nocardioides acrostichi TaxID=2784339 RepID=A0A930Y962_9ACTN|nr:hypothetical protein [Nocardioides acrostichi]MBF4163837.1 hypothetical protein [Nocardioides acrostichi]